MNYVHFNLDGKVPESDSGCVGALRLTAVSALSSVMTPNQIQTHTPTWPRAGADKYICSMKT